MSSARVRGLKPGELEQLRSLLVRSYSDKSADLISGSMMADPQFELKRNRVIEQEGRIVARLYIHDRTMLYGGETIRVGAIGGVCVDPDWRKRGFCRLLLEDATDFMNRDGCHISLLFGRYEVYAPSGWYPLICRTLICSLPALPNPSVAVRPATLEKDVAILSKLHSQFITPLTGPFERSPAYWQKWIGNKLHYRPEWKFWLVCCNGHYPGYFATRDDLPDSIFEMVWDRQFPGALQALLGAVFQQYPDRTIRFPLDIPQLRTALLRGIENISRSALVEREHGLTIAAGYGGMFKLLQNRLPGSRAPKETAELLRLLRRKNFHLPLLDHF